MVSHSKPASTATPMATSTPTTTRPRLVSLIGAGCGRILAAEGLAAEGLAAEGLAAEGLAAEGLAPGGLGWRAVVSRPAATAEPSASLLGTLAQASAPAWSRRFG